jgi:hypothetical protein
VIVTAIQLHRSEWLFDVVITSVAVSDCARWQTGSRRRLLFFYASKAGTLGPRRRAKLDRALQLTDA